MPARRGIAALALALAATVAACAAPELPPPPSPPKPAAAPAYIEYGVASWYGPGFEHHRTAGGERFDGKRFTAAHRTLPLGTQVKVTNLANGRSVQVRITDRGPFLKGRVIDLSVAAAHALGMTANGLARVRIEELPEATAGL